MQDILEEIAEERQKQTLLKEENLTEAEEDDNVLVLVACKDERSCLQLEDCIMNSSQKVFFFTLFFWSNVF